MNQTFCFGFTRMVFNIISLNKKLKKNYLVSIQNISDKEKCELKPLSIGRAKELTLILMGFPKDNAIGEGMSINKKL